MTRNFMGDWFNASQRVGEIVSIPVGRISAGNNHVEWQQFPHDQFDGIGALAHVLRQTGQTITKLPVLADPSRPGFFQTLRAILLFLADGKLRFAPWKSYDLNWKGRPYGKAWHVFTENETKAIVASAKRLGVSVGSVLLSALNRSVPPLLQSGRGGRKWMVSVNMRGGVTRNPDTAMHASYIGVELLPEFTPQEVHQRIHELLNKKLHWVAWWAMYLAALGRSVAFKITRYYYDRGHSWTGVFSNLGVWTPGASSLSCNSSRDSWLISPPITQTHPIGAGCVTWNGRLAITLQVHPVLNQKPSEADRFLSLWRKELIK